MSNNNAVEKLKYRGYKISIFYDEDSQNPYKNWDQLTDVNFWLRDYDLDSTGSGQLGFKGPQEVVEAYEAGELAYFAPIRAYIHSGITISLGNGYPFNDVWDSGLAGMVYVTKEKAAQAWPKLGGRTLWLACARTAKCEIETLDQYLTDQVYGYVIKRRGIEGDSCWGMYGLEYCIQSAKEAVDEDICWQEKAHEKVLDAWFGFIPEEVMTYAK